MLRSLAVEALSIRGFRNLSTVDVELGPRLNVVSGANGQGKTNLIEAIYVLATSRSFRASRIQELVPRGGERATIRARIREGRTPREQVVALGQGVRSTRIDGKRPPTVAAYALQTPTIVFHPGALSLTAGGGAERRRLLDRVALYRSPGLLEHAEGYRKAIRSRQRILELRGANQRDLDGWEQIAAEHGVALSDARAEASVVLLPAATRAFGRIGSQDKELRGHYQRSAPGAVAEYRAELERRRGQDRARRSASVGPHRDEIILELSGLPMRTTASQGQHRAAVLALKLAEIEVVAATRDVRPILLLDDVSSELDRERTTALFRVLADEASQVVLTTTRPELIVVPSPSGEEARRDFGVVEGRIAPL